MAYHTQNDVESLLKQLNFTFTANSKITATDLATFLADTDRYIDNRLASHYVTPVVDAAGVLILKPVAAQLTAAKCWRIIYAAQPGESNKAKEWERLSESVLGMIVSKQMALGSATRVSLSDKPYSAMADSEAIWKMNTDQW